MLQAHLAKFPGEASPLRDTADEHWATPRQPSGREFVPVGHVSLEKAKVNTGKDVFRNLDIPDLAWIKSLYLSWAIQGGGLGKAAMEEVERIAALEPLGAKVLALDTVTSEFQKSALLMKFFFTDRGLEVPKVSD